MYRERKSEWSLCASVSECGAMDSHDFRRSRSRLLVAVLLGHAGECVSIRINCKNQKFNNSYYFPMRERGTGRASERVQVGICVALLLACSTVRIRVRTHSLTHPGPGRACFFEAAAATAACV